MTINADDQYTRIMAAIAAKHGVALSEDDPILMVYTLNEILLQENNKAHQMLLNNFRATLEENIHHWSQATESRANLLSQTSSRNIHQLSEQVVNACFESIDQKIESSFNEKLKEITTLSRNIRLAALINLWATSLFFGAVLILLLVF
ncbi:conjugal transfer protein TraM [Nitrosomonas sp. JL21]|uniref:conjugal transfer protein TraM n=1 Tax=Nitrosomonas sp. JL21 TaxID=153949 RepID=UPI00136ED011|nr:conjugal transfer protein TraM [Nitrosomonas sp. JL21]MXS79070.1 conjugal transfer protein TraM [Nitrosomonas sp. JL21]